MEDMPGARKTATLYKLIVLLIGAGVFLQSGGFVTPGWVVVQRKYTNFTAVHQGGLWYVVLCENPTKCDTLSAFNKTVYTRFYWYSIYSTSDWYSHKIQKWQIGCSFAFASSLLAIFMISLTKLNSLAARFSMKTEFYIVSMILCLGSGVLSVALCAELGNEQVKKYNDYIESLPDTYRNGDTVSPVGFPYSLFLFGLGGLSLTTAFVFLVLFVVFNMYVYQIEILNALKYQVQDTQTTVSGNASCPEPGPTNILSTDASISNANGNEAAMPMQSDLFI